MKQLNFEIPSEVKEYLRILHETFEPFGFDVYLGGGFLRDTFSHRGDPKDLDVFVVPQVSVGDSEVDLPLRVMGYKAALNKLNDDTYMCQHMVHGDYFEDMRDRGVLKVMMGFSTLCGMESQIIMYDHYLNLEEMTEDFDFSINQIVMAPDGNIYCSDAFLEDHEDKVIRQTSIYTKQRMQDRLNRMVSKYPSYRVDTTITPEDGKDDPKDKLNRTMSVLEE